jgi:hypothetical protein
MIRLALVCALILGPGAALACRPAQCRPAVLLGETRTIPANAPAIPFTVTSRVASDEAVFENGVELRDGAGALLESTIEADPGDSIGRLVRPALPFTPGTTLGVRLTETCGGPATGESSTVESHYVIGPAAPLPTRIGTLEALDPELLTDFSGSTGAFCGQFTFEKVLRRRLKLTLDPALTPWLAVTRLELLVSGTRWSLRRAGEFDAAALAQPPADEGRVKDVNILFRACGKVVGVAGEDRGLTAGHFTARLVAHVAGAPSDPPPLEIPIDLLQELESL